MKALFLDCSSGISGDMMVGALVDLGVKPSTLEWELSKLAIGDFHMHFDRAQRQHVEGVKFGIHEGDTHVHEPAAEDSHSNCCHDHDHDHGHSHAHTHEHEHVDAEDGPTHSHQHTHGHGGAAEGHEPDHEHHHGHDHVHGRSHAQIRELIQASALSPFVKERALSIFQRIAVAEGKIHGMPAADVTFHEVGALDSIADIICVCVGLETLGVEKVFVSALHDGRGTIHCAHGIFPLPAPATLEILCGIPLSQIDEPHELITPTGAAIAAEFGASFGLMPQMQIERIGYGLGTRELASRPNVLRAVLGTVTEG